MKKGLQVKILVTYHKPAFLLKNSVLTPIHVGRGPAGKRLRDGAFDQKAYTWLTENMMGDDSGDNISAKNGFYSELSALYWAWKNPERLENPDYVGFMHYRRQLLFDDAQQELFSHCPFAAPDSQYRINCLQDEDIKRLFSEEQICAALNGVDVLTARPAQYPVSVYRQYVDEKQVHVAADLDLTLEILTAKYPAFTAAAREYMDGNRHYFWNMFVMRRELFDEYCAWLFAILTALEQKIDYAARPPAKQRVFGYIAERLLGIYLTYLKNAGMTVKEKYALLEEQTEIPGPIQPAFAEKTVPVVLVANDSYAPYLGVTIQSIIEHGAADNNYDIFVLNEDISAGNRGLISGLIGGRTNFSIRFVDVKPYLKGIDLSIFSCGLHFALPTYYRFFIPQIFGGFDKVLYLDCDLVALTDIAELYHTPLNGCMLGAACDMEIIRCLQEGAEAWERWRSYLKDTLKMRDPHNYFQAGVLLMNVGKMRASRFAEQCLDRLREIGKPVYVDQDVLNSLFEDDVAALDLSWNLEWHLALNHRHLDSQLLAAFYESYTRAYAAPKIVHYSSQLKPWHNPSLELAHYFWQYARRTPFYEKMLYTAAMPGAFTETMFNGDNYRLLQLVLQRKRLKWRCWRYKILSKINGKRKRRHYALKAKQAKYEFKAVRALCQGKPMEVVYKHLAKSK